MQNLAKELRAKIMRHEKLHGKTNSQILSRFFECGGLICNKGFKMPSAVCYLSSIAIVCLDVLGKRNNGNGYLKNVIARFNSGEIDGCGKPIRSRKPLALMNK